MGFPATATGDNTGGAVNGVTFVGVVTSGTYTNLLTDGGVGIQLDDTTDVIDYVLSYSIPKTGQTQYLYVDGYLQGTGDSGTIQVYDFTNTQWVTRASMVGQTGTTNVSFTVPIGEDRFSSAAGAVYVRFNITGGSNQTLFLDRAIVDWENQSQYGGKIYIDTTASNTDTESYIDGTAGNPVSTIAAANTINGNVSLDRFYVRAGSSITLAASQTGQLFEGEGWNLAGGGQDVSNSHFYEPIMSGTFVTTSGNPDWHVADVGTVTCGPSDFHSCEFLSAFTANGDGDYFFYQCNSGVAGALNPTFDFSGQGATTNVSFRGWSGGGSWTFDSDCVATVAGGEGGTWAIVNAGGAIEVRGMAVRNLNITTSGSGTVNVVGIFGNIVISGTGGTVNIEGMYSTFENNSTGTTVNNMPGFFNLDLETDFTFIQIQRLIAASLLGKLSGAGTTTITIRDINDTIDRIVATVDASENRTAITYNTT